MGGWGLRGSLFDSLNPGHPGMSEPERESPSDCLLLGEDVSGKVLLIAPCFRINRLRRGEPHESVGGDE